MSTMRTKILVLVLPLLSVEALSLSGDLILRGSMYHTINTMPLFLMLLISAAFMYFMGFKYMGISIWGGLIIGIFKMNYIFYLEDLNGQGTMNGAYALFICLYKGALAGFIVDAVFAVAKRLAQTGILRSKDCLKSCMKDSKIW